MQYAAFSRALARIVGVVAIAGLVALFGPRITHAGQDPVYTEFLSDTAVDGYDPVAYFTDGKPVEGSDKYETEYNGATWRFTSAEHRDAFIAEPAKYAPQYGGYCAWAVSQGYTAKGDPQHWRIVDGKLYLNYNADVQKKWTADIPGHITAADGNWPKVLE
ncbi:YHS domain-containing (seleno)protein [Thalassobaculum litoreum]|uniref:YHS domain-containing protein n=1 Tax=Thalassobaculum litoreum DSM 18839 TaxID=1123362 RepID=A0A8G2BJN9_9PROT|nr:YHS domain-containing protein [Thalassobaculum litoreum DSM 18839]